MTPAALAVLVALDVVNIGLHLVARGERMVTSQVFTALLGATAAQVGAIAR